MNYDFDIAVIGGGPAGSSVALNLARKNFNLCLFEKKNFPRETICGEFLSKEVVENLKHHDLFHEFLSLNPNKIERFRFINNDSREISARLDFPSYSLKRSTLDLFLLEHAKKNGAVVFQPAEVLEIIKYKKYFKVVFKCSGNIKEIFSREVIAAYGKQNRLDKLLNRNFSEKKSNFIGIKLHIHEKYFNNINKSEIQIYAGNKIYCGINAVNENMFTLCFLSSRDDVKIPKELLLNLSKENKKFNSLFNTDLQTIIINSPFYGTGNIYFGKKKVVEQGIFMLGDSAGIIAPLVGDGIGMAFESAKMLAENFHNEKKLVKSKISSKYSHEWNRKFFFALFLARIIQNVILNKYLRFFGFNLIKTFPNLLKLIIKKTRN